MGRLHHKYLSAWPGYSMNGLVTLAIIASGLILTLRAAPVTPYLHNTSFDGGLHWSLDMLRVEADRNLYWDIIAHHVTSECKFSNEMFSRWEIQGIESYLLFGDSDIAWVSVLGNTVHFARSDVEKNGQCKTSDGCVLMKTDDGIYVVKDTENNLWFYERGLLTRIEFGSGLVAQCELSEGIIRELSVNNRKIFTTHWDGNSLHIGPASGKAIVIKYDDCRQLIHSISYENDTLSAVEFGYAGKLVASIRLGGRKLVFAWEKVPFSLFQDASLDYSYYLKSDAIFTYKHEYLLGNYILKSIDRYGNREAKILNLKNETITYYK